MHFPSNGSKPNRLWHNAVFFPLSFASTTPISRSPTPPSWMDDGLNCFAYLFFLMRLLQNVLQTTDRSALCQIILCLSHWLNSSIRIRYSPPCGASFPAWLQTYSLAVCFPDAVDTSLCTPVMWSTRDPQTCWSAAAYVTFLFIRFSPIGASYCCSSGRYKVKVWIFLFLEVMTTTTISTETAIFFLHPPRRFWTQQSAADKISKLMMNENLEFYHLSFEQTWTSVAVRQGSRVLL